MAPRSAKADPHSRSRTCVPGSICILQFTEVVRLAGAVGSEVAAGTPAERAPGTWHASGAIAERNGEQWGDRTKECPAMGHDRSPLQTRACGRWLPAVGVECRPYVYV